MTATTFPSPPNITRILEERASRLAQLTEENGVPKKLIELATFHLGKEHMGIPTSLVCETQPLRAHLWTKVPYTPSFIIGIINLRSRIYSIMDISRFLELPSQTVTENTHILLVRGGLCTDGREMELTFITDDLPQIQTIPLDTIHHPPDSIPAQVQIFVQGVTPEMLIVLNINRLLSDPRIIINEEF